MLWLWRRVTSNVLTRLVLWLIFGTIGAITGKHTARQREKERRRVEDEAISKLVHKGRYDA